MTSARAFAAASALLWPAFACARAPLSVTLGAGVQYDSNISIEEADIPTRRGDEALLLQASVQLTAAETKRSTLRFGYSYDDERNRTLDQVSITFHGVSAGVTRRIGRAALAADYQYSHVLLGGHPYLDIHSVSPSIAGFVDRNLYLRLGATWQSKGFTDVDALDADTTLVSLDGYRFFARRKGYVALGLRADSEHTRAAQYRFGAVQGSLRLQVPIRVGRGQWKARAGLAYQEREYLAPFPSIRTERHETRLTLSGGLEVPVTGGVTLRPQARYIDRHSNVAFYDYREHVLSVTASLKL
ncbi:hypothetical protein [Novosphingobium huizhouense]|uniref:hypothetical protein n=1 Tax=Novosphingobium huizhouense TaxID=2866625 RepID=UPI001CD875EE|nr:hypothetical protein [Novosphingobium huizhouense]